VPAACCSPSRTDLQNRSQSSLDKADGIPHCNHTSYRPSTPFNNAFIAAPVCVGNSSMKQACDVVTDASAWMCLWSTVLLQEGRPVAYRSKKLHLLRESTPLMTRHVWAYFLRIKSGAAIWRGCHQRVTQTTHPSHSCRHSPHLMQTS
jgi:hypothetical protein